MNKQKLWQCRFIYGEKVYNLQYRAQNRNVVMREILTNYPRANIISIFEFGRKHNAKH
jgi:hypothetical protein